METKSRDQEDAVASNISTSIVSEPFVDPEKASYRDVLNSSSQQVTHPRNKLLCPSASANTKATLLGVVQPDGKVGFIKDRIEVTREFLDMISDGSLPEIRFRFSSTCMGGACKQWANGECSLPERLANIIPISEVADAALPDCSIRDQCRWFAQRGSSVCCICPLVVTRGDSQQPEAPKQLEHLHA